MKNIIHLFCFFLKILQDLIRVVNYHAPAGASVRVLAHFGQNVALDRSSSESFIYIGLTHLLKR